MFVGCERWSFESRPEEEDLRGQLAVAAISRADAMEKCDIRQVLLRWPQRFGKLKRDSLLTDGEVLWWLWCEVQTAMCCGLT